VSGRGAHGSAAAGCTLSAACATLTLRAPPRGGAAQQMHRRTRARGWRGGARTRRSLAASLRAALAASARSRSNCSSFTSCSLNGQALGMPGSLGAFTRPPFFFSSFAFLRWCSFTFFSTLYF
jgi:hypothetical protein